MLVNEVPGLVEQYCPKIISEVPKTIMDPIRSH